MLTLFLWFTLHCAKKLFTSHCKSFSFYQLEKIRIKWTHPFSQSLVVMMIQRLFFIQTTCWISEKEEIHAGHRSGATQSLYRFIFFVASAILHLKPLNVVLLPVILRQVFLYNDILHFRLPCWPGMQPPELEEQPDCADETAADWLSRAQTLAWSHRVEADPLCFWPQMKKAKPKKKIKGKILGWWWAVGVKNSLGV